MIYQTTCSKKTVLIDTSWLRSRHKSLDQEYPNSEWTRIISAITHIELNDDSKSDQMHMRLAVWRQYVALQLSTLLPISHLLASEHQRVEENWLVDFPLVPDFVENVIKSISEGRLIDSENEYINNIERDVKFQAAKEKEIWDNISERIAADPDPISLIHIKIYLQTLLSQNTPLIVHIAHTDINMTPIIKRIGMMKFEAEYPATFAAIQLDVFIRLLRKPRDAKKCFSIFFDDQKIQLTASFITDAKIAFASLPYVDKFITSDKNQAILLQKLYPKYEHNVEFKGN